MTVNVIASLLKQILPKLIESMAAWAADTDSQWDDFAVDVLRFLYDSDLFREWLSGLIANSPAGVLSLVSVPLEVRAEAERRGIDWQKFLAALPTIITLVRAIIGK